MSKPIVMKSLLDASINVVKSHKDGYFESRFVQRKEDTVIIYLSSMSGCNLSCKFCHLTQQKQTTSDEATVSEYLRQANSALEEAFVDRLDESRISKVKNVHFNFMARGDALSNRDLVKNISKVVGRLTTFVKSKFSNANVLFKVSSIFPNNIALDDRYRVNGYDIRADVVVPFIMAGIDNDVELDFYYSLYSLRKEFRKKWIPKALDPNIVGRAFEGRKTGLRLHHALIANQNDTLEDVELIHQWLEKFDIYTIVNIVRYNPFSAKQGTETDERAKDIYLEALNQSPRVSLIQEIPRVGEDVAASCGVFYKS